MKLLSFLFGSSANDQPAQPARSKADVGRGLRQMMLTTPPERTGQHPTTDFPRVYGVLMDWPIGDDIATVFSSSMGTASLYTTSTFGIIGGEGHEPVRAAAIAFVRAADRLFDTSTLTTEYPYPADDRVRFYLLTFHGVRVVETDLASLENGTGAYAEYFNLGQAVLTQLRLVAEQRQ
jgi:hypothetical protein